MPAGAGIVRVGCAHSISLRRRGSKPARRRPAPGRARPGVAYCRVVAQFLAIWSGQLVSQTGTAMTAFALLVWAYQETGRATRVALLGAAWFVPFVVVSPFAGVWVDRLDRRAVMLWAIVKRPYITLGLLALHWTGRLQVWHLYAAEAVAGAAQAFQLPAFMAATTVLVPPRHYARANGLRSMAHLGADALAPLAAGAMLVWVALIALNQLWRATCAVAVAALAAVVAFLFKYYSGRMKESSDALIKANDQCAGERERWAAERSKLEERLEAIQTEIRGEYDAKHIRLLEAHAAQIQRINDDAREHEANVRREYAHNMDTVAAKSAEAIAKLGLVLEKFYDRYVSPRKGPRS